MTTVGFDMGIRNLAYCVVEHDLSGAWVIKAWDNIDLLEGGTSSQTAKSCHGCGAKKATWCDAGKKWCSACATGIRRKKSAVIKPDLPVLPCAVSVKELRPLAVSAGIEGAKKMGKDALIGWAKTKWLMPWKPAKTKDAGLAEILLAMDTWLTSVLPTFATSSLIRLENQPVMKGPTMKSVQMILFTLLSHRLRVEFGWTGAIEFVHAGTKSRGVVITATDISGATAVVDEAAAYRARKKDATDEVAKHLVGVPSWLAFFNGRSKKSDLADAFLMAHRGR
jgi:hypothetical protein